MKKIHYFSFLFAVALIISACTKSADSSNSSSSTANVETKGQSAVQDDLSSKNILQVAIGSEDHSTLVAAVQAAALEDVLVNAGPLTVFAPNNAAFEALPAGTVENLLKPENQSTLARIIKYHASPGKYMGDGLRDGMNLYQATGHYIKVENDGNNIKVAGAKVLGTVEASNGVVHVIDKVLLPPEQ